MPVSSVHSSQGDAGQAGLTVGVPARLNPDLNLRW